MAARRRVPGHPAAHVRGAYLLQRVRDEAHRFAITYHRQKRSKRMTASQLDDVPGLGEIRRKALLRQFGSLKRLKAASVEEIAEVPGIGRRTAEAILAALTATPAQEMPPSTTPADGDGSGAEDEEGDESDRFPRCLGFRVVGERENDELDPVRHRRS